MTKRYQQARKDYEFLKGHHDGDVNDLTGGFGIDDHCFELLENPTKTRAAKLYEDLVEHSFYAGFESDGNGSRDVDLENEQVREIYERYECL